MLKVGLVGFGFMGSAHTGIYRKMNDVKLATVCDIDIEKVKKGQFTAGNIGSGNTVDLSGVKITDNFDELINSPEIDIIDITLPSYLHSKFAVKALNAGKHVLCEKPMALTIKECDDMINAAKKSKKKFMIAQCIRFWPEYVFLRDSIKSKKYGKLLTLSFRRISGTPIWSSRNWLMDEKKSGGAIMDLHIHDVDFVVNLFGKPKEIFSFGKTDVVKKRNGVDYVNTRYSFNNNALVTAECGWQYSGPFPFAMSFIAHFEKATVMMDGFLGKPFGVYHLNGNAEYPELEKTDGYSEEIKYFIDCVINDKKIAVSTPEESKIAVQLALAEKKSIVTNKTIKI